ncbi:peptidylprolyl isomerase [Colwellia sp. TT2012]|uniref:peptidylprolyl isomerase n=1 Tax=Colwellia sp. TT2012 TaxID=1720342 RepID=UPI00070B3161|nr:peptidylprolyl isomerase [Colwellia sp. TT2012]
MKTLLKEPLLHFLLLGAALFYFYALVSDNQASDHEITLSAAKIAQLNYSFEKTRQRPPSKEEFDALVNNYFKEQVAYQKGKELGLLDGDSIIQKRIQQKLEFIVEDTVASLTPSEEQLTVFLTKHSEEYRKEQLFSFVQLYFNLQKHDDIDGEMQTIVAKIKSLTVSEQTKENLLSLSDNIYLEYEYHNMSFSQVARYFGSDFANALVAMELGKWLPDIKSGYGVHIVKLNAKQGGELQSLAAVRGQVKQAWFNQQRQQTLAKFYQRLFVEYQVKQI